MQRQRWQTDAVQIPGLPTLPTDSYYKFKALAGIWLIAGSLGGMALAVVSLSRHVTDLKVRASVLRAQAPHVSRAEKETILVLLDAAIDAANAAQFAVVIATVVAVFGIALAGSGLYEWRRMQRAQDAFLLRQWALPSEPSSLPPPPADETIPESSP